MALKAWIGDAGIHIPSYPKVLEALKNDVRGVFGANFHLEPDSPSDGRFVPGLFTP